MLYSTLRTYTRLTDHSYGQDFHQAKSELHWEQVLARVLEMVMVPALGAQ